MELIRGMQLSIQSYKHNEQVHRVWKNTKIVRLDYDYIVTGHKKTRVIENTGRTWFTREPALCYFYDDLWFNVIVMFKKTGIHYYCNLSSPYIYDGEAIKYIDYDLDVKVFPNGSYKILDQNEYNYHKEKMNYSEIIQKIVEEEMQKLIKLIEEGKPPFNKEFVLRDYKKYLEMEEKGSRK